MARIVDAAWPESASRHVVIHSVAPAAELGHTEVVTALHLGTLLEERVHDGGVSEPPRRPG